MSTRGILTLAFGAPKYVEMAKALARSLVLHSPQTPRTVVTDSQDPELQELFTTVVKYEPSFGSNVRQKMYLDRYSPYEETLFIDSDCLVVGDLQIFWDAFKDAGFAVQGVQTLRSGDRDPFLDVEFLLQRFSLAGIPKFNGGIYFFRRSPEVDALFATARMLLDNDQEFGFLSFRSDGPADEALYGTAMAIHGLTVTDLGQRGMWSPGELQGKITVNAAQGVCSFVKRVGPEKVPRLVHPEIVHFFSHFSDSLVYRREVVRLRRVVGGELKPDEALPLRDELELRWKTVPIHYDRLRRAAAKRLRRGLRSAVWRKAASPDREETRTQLASISRQAAIEATEDVQPST